MKEWPHGGLWQGSRLTLVSRNAALCLIWKPVLSSFSIAYGLFGKKYLFFKAPKGEHLKQLWNVPLISLPRVFETEKCCLEMFHKTKVSFQIHQFHRTYTTWCNPDVSHIGTFIWKAFLSLSERKNNSHRNLRSA